MYFYFVVCILFHAAFSDIKILWQESLACSRFKTLATPYPVDCLQLDTYSSLQIVIFFSNEEEKIEDWQYSNSKEYDLIVSDTNAIFTAEYYNAALLLTNVKQLQSFFTFFFRTPRPKSSLISISILTPTTF